jgi:toxin-antitoxin system PIN domain toxin
VLVDANILLYAIDSRSRFHESARLWLEDALNGSRRIALPWPSLTAFLRIVTHPRALAAPLASTDAWSFVADWLAAPATWVPEAGRGYAEILERLVCELELRGNLVSDAALAALAIEHGLAVVSADSDFARFRELTWINPLAP